MDKSAQDLMSKYLPSVLQHLNVGAIADHLIDAELITKDEKERLLRNEDLRGSSRDEEITHLITIMTTKKRSACFPLFVECVRRSRSAPGHEKLLRIITEQDVTISPAAQSEQQSLTESRALCSNLTARNLGHNMTVYPSTTRTQVQLPFTQVNVDTGSSTDIIRLYEELISRLCHRTNAVFGQLLKTTQLFLPYDRFTALQQCESVTTFRSLHSHLTELGLCNPVEVDSLIVIVHELEMNTLKDLILDYTTMIQELNITADHIAISNCNTSPPHGYFFLYIKSQSIRPLTAGDIWDTKARLCTELMGNSIDRGLFWFQGFSSDRKTIIWQFLSMFSFDQIISAIHSSAEICHTADLVQLKTSTETVTVYSRESSPVSYSGLGKRSLPVADAEEGSVFKRNRFVGPCELLRNKLQNRYKKQDWSASITSGPKIEPEMFVQLALVKKQKLRPEDKTKDEYFSMFLRGSVDDILQKKERVELKTMFGHKSSTVKFLLIEGAPGIGKTRLSCYLCTKWAEGELLQQYDLVIFVPLRRFQTECNEKHSINLITLINLYLTGKKGQEASEELSDGGCSRALVILDGWDELAPPQRREHSFFYDIISGNSPDFENASVIVTSRCSVSSLLYKFAKRRIEVLGFDSTQVDQYVIAHIPVKQEVVFAHFKKFPNIRALSHIPLTLSIICNILQEYESLPLTLTELYDLYIRNNLYIGLRKCKSLKHEVLGLPSLDKLPEDIDPDFKCLTELAMNGFVDDQLVFESSHLANVGLKVVPGFDAFGLLSTIPCHVGAGNEVYYQFRHLTMQEFLAAKYIVDLKLDKRLQFIEKHRLEPKYQVVWKFFSGITHLSDKETRESIISTTNANNNKDVLLLLHCVYEAHNVKVCREAAVHLKRKMKLDNYPMNTTDCLCLAYMLAQSGGRWHITMRGCNMGSMGISTFYSHLVDQQDHGDSPKEGDDEDSPAGLSISTLDLMHNLLHLKASKFCSSGIDVLCELVRGPIAVEHLILNSNALGNERTKLLAEALKSNTSLITLSMGDCELTSHSAKCLAEMLCDNVTLKSILWNNIGAAGAEHFAQVLKSNHTLEELFIGDNNIGERGFIELCEMLKFNRGLKELRVECLIDIHPHILCKHLIDALPHNRHLELIDLCKSKVGDDGVQRIADGIRANPSTSLRKLGFFGCDITNKGVIKLCEIAALGLVESLQLGCNPGITDVSIAYISSALGKSKSLKRLRLEQCKISKDGQRQLEQQGIDVTFIPNIYLDRELRGLLTETIKQGQYNFK